MKNRKAKCYYLFSSYYYYFLRNSFGVTPEELTKTFNVIQNTENAGIPPKNVSKFINLIMDFYDCLFNIRKTLQISFHTCKKCKNVGLYDGMVISIKPLNAIVKFIKIYPEHVQEFRVKHLCSSIGMFSKQTCGIEKFIVAILRHLEIFENISVDRQSNDLFIDDFNNAFKTGIVKEKATIVSAISFDLI